MTLSDDFPLWCNTTNRTKQYILLILKAIITLYFALCNDVKRSFTEKFFRKETTVVKPSILVCENCLKGKFLSYCTRVCVDYDVKEISVISKDTVWFTLKVQVYQDNVCKGHIYVTVQFRNNYFVPLIHVHILCSFRLWKKNVISVE